MNLLFQALFVGLLSILLGYPTLIATVAAFQKSYPQWMLPVITFMILGFLTHIISRYSFEC